MRGKVCRDPNLIEDTEVTAIEQRTCVYNKRITSNH